MKGKHTKVKKKKNHFQSTDHRGRMGCPESATKHGDSAKRNEAGWKEKKLGSTGKEETRPTF